MNEILRKNTQEKITEILKGYILPDYLDDSGILNLTHVLSQYVWDRIDSAFKAGKLAERKGYESDTLESFIEESIKSKLSNLGGWSDFYQSIKQAYKDHRDNTATEIAIQTRLSKEDTLELYDYINRWKGHKDKTDSLLMDFAKNSNVGDSFDEIKETIRDYFINKFIDN
jgi:hypothetical protein